MMRERLHDQSQRVPPTDEISSAIVGRRRPARNAAPALEQSTNLDAASGTFDGSHDNALWSHALHVERNRFGDQPGSCCTLSVGVTYRRSPTVAAPADSSS